jgi:hypothetical protein
MFGRKSPLLNSAVHTTEARDPQRGASILNYFWYGDSSRLRRRKRKRVAWSGQLRSGCYFKLKAVLLDGVAFRKTGLKDNVKN